jgi:hypothetical protein
MGTDYGLAAAALLRKWRNIELDSYADLILREKREGCDPNYFFRQARRTLSPAAYRIGEVSLFMSGEPYFRSLVAYNTLDNYLLDMLALDGYHSVRLGVAKNPAVRHRTDLLEKFLQDSEPQIRREAARRTKNTELLERLLEAEQDAEVKQAAERRLERLKNRKRTHFYRPGS